MARRETRVVEEEGAARALFGAGSFAFDGALLAYTATRFAFNVRETPDPIQQTDTNRWNWFYYLAAPVSLVLFLASLAASWFKWSPTHRLQLRTWSIGLSFTSLLVLATDQYIVYTGAYARDAVSISMVLATASCLCNLGSFVLM